MIGVIGDGQLDPAADRQKVELGRDLGEALVDGGYRIVCGGMGGIMRATCRGARRSDAYREGDTVGILPTARHEDANEFVDIVLPTHLQHARNAIVAQSDALVAIGGGAGTLSEISFGWIHNRLILAFRVDGWSGKLAGERLDDRVRIPSVEDDRIFGVDTAGDAVAILDEKLADYPT